MNGKKLSERDLKAFKCFYYLVYEFCEYNKKQPKDHKTCCSKCILSRSGSYFNCLLSCNNIYNEELLFEGMKTLGIVDENWELIDENII